MRRLITTRRAAMQRIAQNAKQLIIDELMDVAGGDFDDAVANEWLEDFAPSYKVEEWAEEHWDEYSDIFDDVAYPIFDKYAQEWIGEYMSLRYNTDTSSELYSPRGIICAFLLDSGYPDSVAEMPDRYYSEAWDELEQRDPYLASKLLPGMEEDTLAIRHEAVAKAVEAAMKEAERESEGIFR